MGRRNVVGVWTEEDCELAPAAIMDVVGCEVAVPLRVVIILFSFNNNI